LPQPLHPAADRAVVERQPIRRQGHLRPRRIHGGSNLQAGDNFIH
jgi:hypothetical protein